MCSILLHQCDAMLTKHRNTIQQRAQFILDVICTSIQGVGDLLYVYAWHRVLIL
jgi:hypothetical protein